MRAFVTPLLAALAFALLAPGAGAAQDPSSPGWRLRVLDAASGAPLAGVVVTLPETGAARATDSLGVAAVGVAESGAPLRVVVDRVGYQLVDTLLVPPGGGGTTELRLERAAVGLPALTVGAGRAGGGSRELARVIFRRDVAVGAVGMTAAQVREVPAVGEADVLRSLGSLAGVTSVNDYGAGMHVRGGASDQVGVLWEGVPVFGPYHMFGMFGVFNSDAVESLELYKGSMPARHGGWLSGVVSARQRTGGDSGVRGRGGLSLLGVRAAADGSLPWGGARWLAAGRTATVDIPGLGGPYSFHDVNLGLRLYPGEAHRVGFSVLATEDEFAWDFGGGGDWLDSRWSNLVSSLAWSWVRGDRVSGEVAAYASRYEGSLGTGAGPSPPVARNEVFLRGLRAGATLPGRAGRREGRLGVRGRSGVARRLGRGRVRRGGRFGLPFATVRLRRARALVRPAEAGARSPGGGRAELLASVIRAALGGAPPPRSPRSQRRRGPDPPAPVGAARRPVPGSRRADVVCAGGWTAGVGGGRGERGPRRLEGGALDGLGRRVGAELPGRSVLAPCGGAGGLGDGLPRRRGPGLGGDGAAALRARPRLALLPVVADALHRRRGRRVSAGVGPAARGGRGRGGERVAGVERLRARCRGDRHAVLGAAGTVPRAEVRSQHHWQRQVWTGISQ